MTRCRRWTSHVLKRRKPNADCEAGAMSQSEMVAAFGAPCSIMKIYNWESGRSTPPSGEFQGVRWSYSRDLREHPTAKNKQILAAIIEEYKSRYAVKQNARDVRFVHFKNDETLAQQTGVVQDFLRS